jgi:small conductance mechanosensitive channel
MVAVSEEFLMSPLGVLVQVAIVIAAAIVVRVGLHFIIRFAVNRIVNGVKSRQNADDTAAIVNSPLAAVRTVQRTRTIGSLLSNVVSVVIVIVALILIISIAAPGAAGAFSLVTAALGAGLGFGAQNIVKDVLNGLFLVIEDQIGVGDVVDTGFATGVVESVGIRVTQVRDVNGTLWYVRNGEMLRVGNMSQGWSRVIIDVAVPRDADVNEAQRRMLETASGLASDRKWVSRILEKPEVWGIESISADAVVVRLVMKTRSASKDDVARELRARLNRLFTEMGIVLPSLASVVLTGFEGAASVRGAKPPRTRPVAVSSDAPPAKPKKPRSRRTE